MEKNRKEDFIIKPKSKKSHARRMKMLLTQHKGLIGQSNKMVDFREPAMFFLRRNRKGEFYDNVTRGRFDYVSSDGETRFINLDPNKLHSFDYGKRTFKTYICHEDFPEPLPFEPVVTVSRFAIAIEKTLTDMKKMLAKEIDAKGQMWLKILGGLAMLICALAIANMLGFNLLPWTADPVPVVSTSVDVASSALP